MEKRKAGSRRKRDPGDLPGSGAKKGTGDPGARGIGPEREVALRVNGRTYRFRVGEGFGTIEPSHTLAYTLRETLGLTGTKIACDRGACGACSVLVDGRSMLSCMMLTVECGNRDIRTIEGLEDAKTGMLDPLQQAFINQTAFQCGFCTPGMIIASKALLLKSASPAEAQIKEALSGHFCRCISHYHVLGAVKEALTLSGGRDA